MTTPEGANPPTPKRPRVKRPDPGRAGPNRARQGNPADPAPDVASLSDEVAHAVKEGYDVIAENLKQGRIAASRFRQGNYNIRDVPGDLEDVGLRMVRLARELSNTTFDICERLLKELGPAAAGKDRAQDLPAFRPTVAKAGSSAAKAADPALKLTVRFPDGVKAVAHTLSLARPTQPTAPEEISAAPLTARSGAGAPISAVTFQADVAQGGLIALVTPPAGQSAGVYSGLVHAGNEPVPLGVLTIEILA